MKQSALSRKGDSVLRKLDHLVGVFVTVIILSITLLVCCSCSSTKEVIQLVRDVRVDTVYLSNVQYDSIYIRQDRIIDRSRDTLYIKDKSIEYRYRMLRDTIRIVERDSIPYEVTIYKDSINHKPSTISRPLTWYDHLTRTTFWIVIGILFLKFLRFLVRIKKLFLL